MNGSLKLAYTVEEAGELLSLSRAHLYRLIDAGYLGSITIGRSRRVTHNQLVAFVELSEERASKNPLHAEVQIRRRSQNSQGSRNG